MRWLQAPDGSAAYHPPSVRLLGLVRGYLVRDTTQMPWRDEPARRNHYPASPYVSLIWLLQGHSTCLEPPERAGQSLPSVALMGPQRHPWCTRNPGVVRSFGIVFMPDALSRLAGLDMAVLVDRAVPVQHCFNAEWLAWCEAVRTAPNDATRIRVVEAFLLQALRERAGRGGTPSLLSPRSLARRVKALMGIGPRERTVLTRVERALLDARERDAADTGTWADVAVQSGYSDQAHLCRQARRATGHSPGELARRSQTDRGYWLYQVWRDQDVTDFESSQVGSKT